MAYVNKTQSGFKRFMFTRGIALVIIFLIIFMGYSLFSIIGKSREAATARRETEAHVQDLAKKQATLSQKLASINSTEGKERALREQLPVVKDGEHLVIIVDEKKDDGTSTDTASHHTFWSFIKKIFH